MNDHPPDPPYLYIKDDCNRPTAKMMVAGANVLDATGLFDWRDTALLAEKIYNAMVEAE